MNSSDVVNGKRFHVILALLVLTAAVVGLAGTDDSPLAKFTPEQRKQLAGGEVVFEYVINEDDDRDLGYGVAYVVINRPARVCYDHMVRFELKDRYFPRLKKTDIARREQNRVWVHEVLDFRIVELEYVTLMIKDDEKMRVDYRLDQSYPHDLQGFDGYYYFEEVDENSALMTYVVGSVDVGLPVPQFIMKELSGRDLPGIARNVKKRFESDGKWTKP